MHKFARMIVRIFLFLVLLVPTTLICQPADKEQERYAKKKIEVLTEKAKKWAANDIDSSLIYAQQAVDLAYEIDDQFGLQANLLIIGSGFSQLKEYKRAMEVLNKVKAMMEASAAPDRNLEIQLANEMGVLQRELMNYEKALSYHRKAKSLGGADICTVSEAQVLIGKVYKEQGKDSLALETQLAALALQETKQQGEVLSSNLMELGLLYEKLGAFDKAFFFFNKALMQEEDKGNTKAVTKIINTVAASHAKQMQAHASIDASRKALRLAKENNDYDAAAIACKNLATCYKALKKFEQSLEFEKLADVYKNQLLDIEKKRLVTVMQANFDLTQKEIENQALRDKEKLLQRDIKRQMATIGVICLALLLSLGLALMLYRFNQSRKKTNVLLQKQNEAIQAQKVELEKAMEQLKSAQSQLVQSEKMASLGQLTAGIAHEINNPVNFIYSGIAGLKKNLAALMKIVDQYDAIEDKEGFASKIMDIQQLKSTIDYEEVREDIDGLLHSIEDGAERTGAIVNSLKTFSRTDAAALSQVNIHQNIDSTLVLLQNKFRDRITIHKNYDPTLPAVESYTGQLNQVIMNMLTNAMQAIEGPGNITITTKALAEEIVVSIADTGKGIAAVDQPRIFEPFYTTKEVGEGTGLGLSISYGIVEKHKGRIEVDSELGKGTTFDIYLPLRQS